MYILLLLWTRTLAGDLKVTFYFTIDDLTAIKLKLFLPAALEIARVSNRERSTFMDARPMVRDGRARAKNAPAKDKHVIMAETRRRAFRARNVFDDDVDEGSVVPTKFLDVGIP